MPRYGGVTTVGGTGVGAGATIGAKLAGSARTVGGDNDLDASPGVGTAADRSGAGPPGEEPAGAVLDVFDSAVDADFGFVEFPTDWLTGDVRSDLAAEPGVGLSTGSA